ncbi:hypothetical protein TRIUR3_12590 [Triticum urartu]|uniref:Uncharacterized protein n=1 Tax=Triticum urartu TaxID=4572 RepID=M7ZRL5_TRIUA|nr:hypothetical protein TRIUR3_12590 [Triticum urartu]
MVVLLKIAPSRVSFIQIMQIRVQNKSKSVWKSRYLGDVSLSQLIMLNGTLDMVQISIALMDKEEDKLVVYDRKFGVYNVRRKSCPDSKSVVAKPLVSVTSSGGGGCWNDPQWYRAIGGRGSEKGCASLSRLCLGAWVFPDTTALPRGAGFPNLRELVLGCVVMKDKDLEFLLAVSPVLEILAFHGSLASLQARIANQSLRCAQFCLSILEEVAVVNAPSLERLFLWRNWSERGRVGAMSTTVKIGHAPKLRVLGYLEPGVHILQIGSTIIKAINYWTGYMAGTKASARTTVSSLQMLALQVHFGDRSQVKMLPSFLRCFPNLETLIVESFLEENTSNRSLKFWQETSPIECVQSHLKTLSFCELQGNDHEFDFIMFIVENALKLERLIIQIKQDLTYTERQVVVAKLGDLSCANWANTNCKVRFELLWPGKKMGVGDCVLTTSN